MPSTDAIYSLVARVTDVSVDRALASALPTADVEDQRRLAELILRRRHPEATAALVVHFDTLDADVRQWVLEHVADLYRPLREVARLDAPRQGPNAVANAIEIIRHSGEMKLAYLVGERLRHGDEALRLLAAECLLDLARQAVSDPKVTADQAAYLHAAVEEAVRLYRHHEQTPVAEALLTLVTRPLQDARRQIADARQAIVPVLKQMLGAAEHAESRAALVPLLGVAPLTASAVAGLQACARDGGMGDALAHGHLLQLPRVHRCLATIKQAESLWPADDQVMHLPAEQTRHLPTWVAALPLELDVQVQRLAALRHAGDAMTRLAALRRMIELTRREPQRDFGQAIAGFCEDAEESIASAALRELVRQRWGGLARALPQWVNSPHDRLRRVAAEHLAPLGFERLWRKWPQLSRSQRQAAGRALLKLDPRFHESVGRRLASPDAATVLRGLAVIADLNQGSYFEAALLQLASHPDRRVASSAVRAMGSAESEPVRAALETALRDRDARVRANAVEALEQLNATRHVQNLVRMAAQDDNRPRANAIKALLQMRAGDAMAALTHMLADDRASHRRSALWLVETMGLVEVARHVAELAVTDPEPAVKQRATRVMHDLIDTLRDRASAVESAAVSLTWPLAAWSLAAADDADAYWQQISMHFSSGSGLSMWWIAIATGLLLTLIAVLSMRTIRDRAEAKSAPMLVFRRVAEHVGLGASDQWLLIRIARQQELPTPLALLLSPGTLTHHAAAYAAQQGDRKGRLTMLRVDAICRDLFGGPADESAGDTPLREVA
jgi:hypothetical protein